MSPGIYLLLYCCFAVAVFLIKSMTVHLTIAACIVFALFFLPLKKVKSGCVPIVLFLGFTFISNLFNQPGRVLALAGPVTITDEGLRIAALRMLRIFDMVFAAKILSQCAPLEAMIGSLRSVACPLEWIGLPVHEFFSIMALTLQCFPVLKRKLYDAYDEGMKRHSTTAAGPPESRRLFGAGAGSSRVKGFIMNFRIAVALLASVMIPLFIESMADPERFLRGMDDSVSD